MLVTGEGSIGDKKTTLLRGNGLDEKLLGERVVQDSLKAESASALLAFTVGKNLYNRKPMQSELHLKLTFNPQHQKYMLIRIFFSRRACNFHAPKMHARKYLH